MKLRGKLFVALIPLLLSSAAGGVVGSYATRMLGRSAHAILTDNYRSVLAAQHMKEAIERMDSGALFVLAGHRDEGEAQARTQRPRFDAELAVQEHNITEAGEAEATQRVRMLWATYQTDFDAFLLQSATHDVSGPYFSKLLPTFTLIKDGADVVLALNQDAMVRNSDAADAQAGTLRLLIEALVLAACLVAVGITTLGITHILRPLAVVAQTTRRIAQGDMQARAQVRGNDEVADLARELNAMADQLAAYQRSSLGELLEAQQAAQAAVDSLPDPVLVYRAGGELLHLNRAAEALMHGGGQLADGDLARAVQVMRERVETGHGAFAPAGLEHAVRVATVPVPTHYLPRASPLYGPDSDVAGTTVVLQDVTRLVRFDELKSDLVATVAHELRTPLTSLQMALHLCTEEVVGPLTDKQADLLFAARDDCARLQSTVNELLDLSRIQSGGITLHLRSVRAAQLCTAALEAQHAQATQGGVLVRMEVLPGTPDVQADPERLHLVFDNLLSNAIRYTPAEGTVLMRALPDGAMVRFEVHDAGPGVAALYRAAIFERYFQVPGALAGRAGLGLFIAREVVQAHGGRIGVDPAPSGTGSIFWFCIPHTGTA